MSRKSSSLKSFELAYKVLSEYGKDECNIQSTPAIKKCIETLKAAKTWYEAFQAPIITFQFDYSTALHLYCVKVRKTGRRRLFFWREIFMRQRRRLY